MKRRYETVAVSHCLPGYGLKQSIRGALARKMAKSLHQFFMSVLRKEFKANIPPNSTDEEVQRLLKGVIEFFGSETMWVLRTAEKMLASSSPIVYDYDPTTNRCYASVEMFDHSK